MEFDNKDGLAPSFFVSKLDMYEYFCCRMSAGVGRTSLFHQKYEKNVILDEITVNQNKGQ